MIIQLKLEKVEDMQLGVQWQTEAESGCIYRLYWSDRYSAAMEYRCVYEGTDTAFTLKKATHIPHYLKVEAWRDGEQAGGERTVKDPCEKSLS